MRTSRGRERERKREERENKEVSNLLTRYQRKTGNDQQRKKKKKMIKAK